MKNRFENDLSKSSEGRVYDEPTARRLIDTKVNQTARVESKTKSSVIQNLIAPIKRKTVFENSATRTKSYNLIKRLSESSNNSRPTSPFKDMLNSPKRPTTSFRLSPDLQRQKSGTILIRKNSGSDKGEREHNYPTQY